MADKQINGLPVGAPEATDEFAIQKTGGGLNYKYTLANIRTALRAVAEVHSNADYTMTGVTTTPEKLNGYDAALTVIGIGATLTPTAGSNTALFTIDPNKDDPYRITFNIEVQCTNKNDSIDFVLYIDGVATEFKTGVDLSNAAIDIGSAGMNAILPLTAGQTVEMWINTDGATMDILIDSLTFTIQRL